MPMNSKNASVALIALFCVSLPPSYGDSTTIKGGVERNNILETKTEGAAQEGSSGASVELSIQETPPLEGKTSKELLDKTFQLQNSQSGLMGNPVQLNSQVQSQQLKAKANGGEEIYGCLGVVINLMNGIILKIFPDSDLHRLNVCVGDQIVGVNGHRYNFSTIQQEMTGTPGTTIDMVILNTDDVVRKVQVRRVDARLLPQTGFFKQLTKKNKFW